MKHFIKPLIFLILFFSILTDCKKEDSPFACGVEHPEENLVWLTEVLKSFPFADIYKYSFNDVEYIIVEDPAGASSIMERVFICDGTKVCTHGGWPGGGDCTLPSNFWDEYDENKILIYQLRRSLDDF